MFIHKRIRSISLGLKIITISLCLLTNMVLASDSISYEEAKSILESNCGDCYGDSKQGLEKGIAAMEALINNGVDIPLEGGSILADSYNTLAIVHYKHGTEERKLFTNKSKTLYQSLGVKTLKKIDSGEILDSQTIILYTDILNRYAGASDDPAKRIGIHEKILSLNPDNSRARFTYGLSLLTAGKIEEGQAQLERAFATAQFDDAINQARYLMEAFNKKGQYEEAKRIFTLLEGKQLDRDITSLKKNYITDYKKIMGIESPVTQPTKPKEPTPVTQAVNPLPIVEAEPTPQKDTTSQAISNNKTLIIVLALAVLLLIGFMIAKRKKS